MPRFRLIGSAVPAFLASVGFAAAAHASSFTTSVLDVDVTYFTGQAEFSQRELHEDAEHLSHEDRIEHTNVVSTAGFVGDANGRVLRAAAEVGALLGPDLAAGTIWETAHVAAFVNATTRDVMTIEGPTGTGVIRFVYDVDGSLYHDLRRFQASGYAIDSMTAAASLTIQMPTTSAGWGDSYAPALDPINPEFPNGAGVGSKDIASGPQTTEFLTFEFNTPFAVYFSLLAEAEIVATDVDAGGFDWLGGARLDGTAHIQGVEIFDSLGNRIGASAIHSDAGIEYPVVPEPAPALGLALGLTLLSGARSYRRRA